MQVSIRPHGESGEVFFLDILSHRMSRVENRRSGFSLPVAVGLGFRFAASIRFGLTLFPVPAHRTGQAHLAHPALGESVTVSPRESCLSE